MYRPHLPSTLTRSFSTTLPTTFPRGPVYPPFASPRAPVALTKRLEKLQDPLSSLKPRVSDPPRPDRAYPSQLDQPMRRYAKPQRRSWEGPESDVREFKGKWAGEEGFVPYSAFEGFEKVVEQRGGVENVKPSEVFVGRAKVSGFVPIYVEKRQRQPYTIIKRIQGDPKALLDPLLKYLTVARPNYRRGAEGRVKPVNGHIEIRGSWKEEVREFLLSRGF